MNEDQTNTYSVSLTVDVDKETFTCKEDLEDTIKSLLLDFPLVIAYLYVEEES